MKRQLWAFWAELISAAATAVALILLELDWAFALAALTVVLALLTRSWARRDPTPLPYSLRGLMFLPRPFQTPSRLKALLCLRGGERLLEVGPATGKYAIPIAAGLGADGALEVLDVQQEMLDELMRRASLRGIANIAPTAGDAARLPYPDARFDGAYSICVLGEIRDKAAALQELRRVLKPEGRLVIGEMAVDPDFVPLAELRRVLGEAGFTFERSTGPRWEYLALFRKR